MDNKVFLSLVVIAVCAITFAGCNKLNDESNKIVDNSKSKQISFEEIDLISSEIADFHTYAIKKYMNEIYNEKDILNDEYVRKINDYLLISSKCKIIDKKAYDLFLVSNSLEEYKEKYFVFVKEELSTVTTINEYMSLRFFADVYMSSFESWGEYLYSNGSKALSWWEKTKQFAKDAWAELKPTVMADVGGAAGGALVGAAVGGIGAIPGAAGGAVCTSVAVGIGNM
ncbi:MAG: hypothetical protein LBV69_09425 [Bacteroidales bacterium]|jgi:hypothetical protein|nr:hypothetical protein [Bacteroidales bacterium]